MRLLFHAPPLVGHTLPMLPLANALRGLGHTVAWAAGEDTQALLRAQGFDCHEAGPSRSWAVSELNHQWPERASLTPMQVVAELGPRVFAGVYAPTTLPALLALVDKWRPDLIVHDVMAHAAPLAGAVHRVRSVSHGFGLPRATQSIEAAELRMAPLWQAHGLELPPDSGNHRSGHVDICPPSMRLDEPLPSGTRWAMSPTSGVRRMAGERTGVLASFGTLHHLQAAFERLLDVLAQGPWPARVALGRALSPERTWPAHVHAAPWLDLADEWSRSQVGANHGGAGTLLGALAQGVPLLVLPVAADQFRNARGLQRCGAGIALVGDEQQTVAAMHDALQRLFDDPSYTQAAQRMADELAGMPQAHQVALQIAQALLL